MCAPNCHGEQDAHKMRAPKWHDRQNASKMRAPDCHGKKDTNKRRAKSYTGNKMQAKWPHHRDTARKKTDKCGTDSTSRQETKR